VKRLAHNFGTRTSTSFDTAAMREGLASPGLDQRYWVSRGTIGTMHDDGTFDPTDPHAVWIGPEGVECDVKLEPLEQMCTALWSKGSAECSDISPIRPGDQVVVENPGGDLMTPVIIAVVHSRGAKQPMTAGVPIFDNRRRLIYQRTTDLDVRCAAGQVSLAAGPTSIWIKQDVVQLGAGDASHPVMQGDNWQSAVNEFLAKLGAALMTVAPVATDGGTLITALNSTDIPKLIAAAYLSNVVKTT
jgi:hypothetical protein